MTKYRTLVAAKLPRYPRARADALESSHTSGREVPSAMQRWCVNRAQEARPNVEEAQDAPAEQPPPPHSPRRVHPLRCNIHTTKDSEGNFRGELPCMLNFTQALLSPRSEGAFDS
jgi:hypothetical protein